MPARYLIGIDLGTTNSAVAYVDTQTADTRVRVFEVEQLVAPGEVAPRRQLPSFVYLAGDMSRFVTGSTIHLDGGTWAAAGWKAKKDGGFTL